MNQREVWRKIQKSKIPENRRLIKCKWVFEIKRDGRFRARLVTCGYSQIPGVDFSEAYAPVIHDVTWRILLIIYLNRKYEAKIIDIETAFLYGELEEEIYMECPEGLTKMENDCLILQKTIYGLVQAARQYWKKFTTTLKQLKFEGGNADPCLFYRKTENGIVYIGIYVDDYL